MNCTKVKFINADTAFDFIETKVIQTKRKGRPVIPVSAYFCPNCLAWHITSRAKKAEAIEVIQLKSLSDENARLKQELLLASQSDYRQKLLRANRDLYETELLLKKKNLRVDGQKTAISLLNGKIERLKKLHFSAALKRIHDKHEARNKLLSTLYP